MKSRLSLTVLTSALWASDPEHNQSFLLSLSSSKGLMSTSVVMPVTCLVKNTAYAG